MSRPVKAINDAVKAGPIDDERKRWPNLTDRDRAVARLAAQAVLDIGVAPNVDGEMANDRYTTEPTLAWCRKVLGVDAFDLDVAACVESHKAPRWYGHHEIAGNGFTFVDGLIEPWNAARIWVNPPYDDLLPWVDKAWATMFASAGTSERWPVRPIIGMLIPDNRREQPFWQRLVEPFRDGRWERPGIIIPEVGGSTFATSGLLVAHDAGARLFTHSLPGRQPFGVPGNPEGKGQQSPPFGVVLLEWRFV